MQKIIDVVGGTLSSGLWFAIPVGLLVAYFTLGVCDNSRSADCTHYSLIVIFLSPFILSFLIQILRLFFADKIQVNKARTQKISGTIFIVFSLPVGAFFGLVFYIAYSFQGGADPVTKGIASGLPIFLWLLFIGIRKIKTAAVTSPEVGSTPVDETKIV